MNAVARPFRNSQMFTTTMPSSVADDETPPAEAAGAAPPRNGFRQMIDALVCLALAVILVRGYLAEGYMISTGSMAPTLPGFHKRVTCPSCRYEFAVGVVPPGGVDRFESNLSGFPRRRASAYQGEVDNELVESGDEASPEKAVCPNCGQHSIDISGVPRNQGDQLLVHKNAYAYMSPHRWEVVVFRNPARPAQAYVKRIVGLPGETISILHGDVAIDGEIQRKDLMRQRAMRILVYNHDFEPQNDPEWSPRWLPENNAAGWKRDGSAFVQHNHETLGSAKREFTWVGYRHWLRTGGDHRTVLKIPESLKQHDFTNPSLFPLQYDAANGTIAHTGVLSARARDRVAKVIANPDYEKLVRQLCDASHVAPVCDEYGYNRVRRGYRPVAVRDLMFAAKVSIQSGHGRFTVEMTDGRQRFQFILDAATRDVALNVDGSATPVRTARLKTGVIDTPIEVEMSLFDRQVIVAINGQRLFSPLPLGAITPREPYSRRPVRFGATDLSLRVDSLRIYRDVHYTKKGGDKPVTLGENEFFVLGDNSPISADSRVWPHSGVHRRLFLGKPILVHLPSRPGNFQFGGTKVQFRIPDFSRIRYIR